MGLFTELKRRNVFRVGIAYIVGAWLFTCQGMIKGLAGDQEAAIDDLVIALDTPTAFRITVWDLYYDPNWDFMRDNPRFLELATPPTVIRTTTQ